MVSLHLEGLKNPCGCPGDTCKSELRIFRIEVGQEAIGPVADQYTEALGQICQYCEERIDNRKIGHICNCTGLPEHEDCYPDRD